MKFINCTSKNRSGVRFGEIVFVFSCICGRCLCVCMCVLLQWMRVYGILFVNEYIFYNIEIDI